MQKNNIKGTCCFIGHRKVENKDKIEKELFNIVKQLIIDEDISIFLFGSRSEFNDLCYKVVSELKQVSPNILRIYVRAEYPIINEEYNQHLLKYYEETFFPDKIINAGKSIYIQRNKYLIDNSNVCVFHFIPNNYSKVDLKRKSGTKLALDYAKSKKKNIIMI